MDIMHYQALALVH